MTLWLTTVFLLGRFGGVCDPPNLPKWVGVRARAAGPRPHPHPATLVMISSILSCVICRFAKNQAVAMIVAVAIAIPANHHLALEAQHIRHGARDIPRQRGDAVFVLQV